MNEDLKAPWIFIIDTEDYAGNFERPLCAYITGRIGECGDGEEEAELYKKETKLNPFDNVIDEADEHGCHRPTSIFPTPGWYDNGFGFGYKAGQEKEALEAYRKQTAEYHRTSYYVKYWEDWQKNPESKKRYEESGWTEKKLKKAAKDEEKKAVEAENTTKVSKYPCYNSVAISFEKKPTKTQIELMKDRAYKFAKLSDEYSPEVPRISKITGFRLIKNVIVKTPKEKSV